MNFEKQKLKFLSPKLQKIRQNYNSKHNLLDFVITVREKFSRDLFSKGCSHNLKVHNIEKFENKIEVEQVNCNILP